MVECLGLFAVITLESNQRIGHFWSVWRNHLCPQAINTSSEVPLLCGEKGAAVKRTILPPCLSSPFLFFCGLHHVVPLCYLCFSVKRHWEIFSFADFKHNHFLIFIFHEAKMNFLPMVRFRRKCNDDHLSFSWFVFKLGCPFVFCLYLRKISLKRKLIDRHLHSKEV